MKRYKHERYRGRNRAKRRALTALFCMIFLIGLTICFWPQIVGAHLGYQAHVAVSDFYEWAEHAGQSNVSFEYVDGPMYEPTPTAMPYPELYQAMQEYNRQIYASGQSGLCDAWAYQKASFDLTSYDVEEGAIGVISIPAMDVELPIYLGATADNMAKGAVHLSQTSLPVGGINTNCVIAAHRGWYGAPYFRYIDVLTVGDEIHITTLWEELVYTVSEIKVIEPSDINQILIQDGRDMLTLLTCHPYASGGRYRYVVYCDRVSS